MASPTSLLRFYDGEITSALCHHCLHCLFLPLVKQSDSISPGVLFSLPFHLSSTKIAPKSVLSLESVFIQFLLPEIDILSTFLLGFQKFVQHWWLLRTWILVHYYYYFWSLHSSIHITYFCIKKEFLEICPIYHLICLSHTAFFMDIEYKQITLKKRRRGTDFEKYKHCELTLMKNDITLNDLLVSHLF